MSRPYNTPLIILVVRVFALIILLLVLLLSLRVDTLKLLFEKNVQQKWNSFPKPFIPSQDSCGQHEAFSFIPKATACKWAQTEFLVVFGVPSVDRDQWRRRRDLQRATCWTFPGVATRANTYNGSLLVLYALARHPAHGFAFSESLRLEGEQWHDIVTLPVNEGRVTTNKQVGVDGYWGDEAEIGMSKKTFFWLQFALRAFPLAVHLGKGDDDMFMNVPQYLADLRLLPQRRIYWGTYIQVTALKNKKMERVGVNLITGFLATLARDVAEAVVTYEPLRHIAYLPYSKERNLDFLVLNMNHEDVMVGRVLKETGYPVIFVAEQWGCRFCPLADKFPVLNISDHHIVVHHIKEHEYHLYMLHFIKNGIRIQNTSIYKTSPTMYRVKCPFA